jgi:hypothetical protein
MTALSLAEEIDVTMDQLGSLGILRSVLLNLNKQALSADQKPAKSPKHCTTPKLYTRHFAECECMGFIQYRIGLLQI